MLVQVEDLRILEAFGQVSASSLSKCTWGLGRSNAMLPGVIPIDSWQPSQQRSLACAAGMSLTPHLLQTEDGKTAGTSRILLFLQPS